MIFRKVDLNLVEQAAQKIGAYTYSQSSDPRRLTLRPNAECVYKRRSSAGYGGRGRRVHAVCWHGHREFFRELFKLAPDAKVSTALAKYTAENFEQTFPSTDKNIGPQVAPLLRISSSSPNTTGRTARACVMTEVRRSGERAWRN